MRISRRCDNLDFHRRGLTQWRYRCGLSQERIAAKEEPMAVTAIPRARTSDAEWRTRVDLAACYRLIDLFGWSDLINSRITARIPGPQQHFLINRFGMLYDEMTASS